MNGSKIVLRTLFDTWYNIFFIHSQAPRYFDALVLPYMVRTSVSLSDRRVRSSVQAASAPTESVSKHQLSQVQR